MRLSNLTVLLEQPPLLVVASSSAFASASAAFLDLFFEVFSSDCDGEKNETAIRGQ